MPNPQQEAGRGENSKRMRDQKKRSKQNGQDGNKKQPRKDQDMPKG